MEPAYARIRAPVAVRPLRLGRRRRPIVDRPSRDRLPLAGYYGVLQCVGYTAYKTLTAATACHPGVLLAARPQGVH